MRAKQTSRLLKGQLIRKMTRKSVHIAWMAVLLMLAVKASGQDTPTSEYVTPVMDSAYIGILCDSSWNNMQDNRHDLSLKQAERALTLAESRDLQALKSRAVILAAYGYHNTHQHEQAENYYRWYMQLQDEMGEPYDTFYLPLNIAKCYTHLGRTPEAIEYYEIAYDHLDPDNQTHYFEYYWSLSFFFYTQRIYDRSVDLRHKVHEVALATGDSLKILKSLNSLGFGYNAASENDSAIVYLEQAALLSEQVGDRFQEWSAKACLGICHIMEERYALGIALLEEAQPIGLEYGEDLCCGNGAFLAEAYVAVGQMSDAYDHMRTARRQLPNIEDHIDKQNVLLALYRTYDRLGDSDAALDMLERLNEVEDEIDTRSYQAQVAELDVRAKTRDLLQQIFEKDSTIERQSTRLQNLGTWLILLLVTVVIVSAGWWFTIRNRASLRRKYVNEIERLSLLAETVSTNAPMTDMERIEQAIMEQMGNSALRISDISASLNFSQRRINRAVRSHSGMTPVQLITTLRIQKAKQLLAHSSMNVAEIAYQVGYNDPAYFTNVFKKRAGISPTGWRKQQDDGVKPSVNSPLSETH